MWVSSSNINGDEEDNPNTSSGMQDEPSSHLIKVIEIIGKGSTVKSNLIAVLEILQTHLVCTDEETRKRSTNLVAKLLENNLELDSSAVSHLTAFFNGRLDDYPSLVPSLQALIDLARNYMHANKSSVASTVPSAFHHDALLVLTKIFDHLNVQSIAQSIRQLVYDLVYEYFSIPSIVSGLQSNGPAMVSGVLIITEGERDPRCLLKSLRLIEVAMRNFPTAGETCSESAFDSIAGYFPIVFRPSAGNVVHIFFRRFYFCSVLH